MTERQYKSDREREVVERALANEELMRQERAPQEAIARGEKGTPWKDVHAEARRRGKLSV